jgi:transcriptional regulator with XRE-family HTH domain
LTKDKELLVIRLVQALEASGLTRTGLARRIGVSRGVVSRWFSGEKEPSHNDYAPLAVALGVSADWLANGLGPMQAAGHAAEAGDPAEEAVWHFRAAPQDGGRDYGNANVWSFEPGLEVLVREVLQNAQDAARSGEGRVEVVFRLIRLAGVDKRAYLRALEWDSLRGHLEASAAGGQKLGTLLRDGLGRIDDRELLLLVVEDRCTVGLTGPERGQGHFTALCRNNLDSRKDGTAGGAYGLGKAVLWRASRFATVLFGSHLSAPVDGRWRYRLFGRCDLSWHRIEAAEYAGPAGSAGRPRTPAARSPPGKMRIWPGPCISIGTGPGRAWPWWASTTPPRTATGRRRSWPGTWPGRRPGTTSRPWWWAGWPSGWRSTTAVGRTTAAGRRSRRM